MKANMLFLLTTVLQISACSPSPAAIETAIAQTQIAQAPADVVTPQPLTSDSPSMTPTPLTSDSPSMTPTPLTSELPTMTPTPLPIEDGEYGTAACAEFIQQLTGIVFRWEDAVELASNTQRIALTDRVADLQAIRREARQLEEPLCSERLAAKPKLLEMMDHGIDLFTAFMADRDNSVTSAHLRIAADLFSDAFISLGREKNEPPHRIHYYVFGDTGLTLEYTDENGELIRIPERPPAQGLGRIGFDKMPAVFSVLIPKRDDIAFTIRLFNATYPDRQMHCYIFSNGQIIREASGVSEVICSYVP